MREGVRRSGQMARIRKVTTQFESVHVANENAGAPDNERSGDIQHPEERIAGAC